MAGEKKMTNQLCVLCVAKNCYLLLITIFPTANMRRAYKTDKSKRSHLAFWQEQKLKPDRPSPKITSFRDKSI